MASNTYRSTAPGAVFFRLILLFAVVCISARADLANQTAVEKAKAITIEIAGKSFPEIKIHKLHFKSFKSGRSFFKARFSIARFLTFQRMRHVLYVNPRVFEKAAPTEGVRSIIAHELAHVSYYTRKSRIELLGLSRLTSRGFIAKFERKADIEAIARGYGHGLIMYRKWLYKNIGQKEIPEKKRNYFSPEELNVILEVLQKEPAMIDVWRKRVPLNLEEIKKSV